MLSMSCGLMSFIVPFMMIPSTTISGESDRFSDLAPRSRIAGAAPGRPLGVMTWAPVTFPCRDWSALVAGTGRFAWSTLSTVNASFLASVAPVTPVTTTSDRRLMSTSRVKSSVWLPALMVTILVCGLKPIARIDRAADWPRTRSPAMVIRYVPSSRVPTETLRSAMRTLAA